ncbi:MULTISPECIES: DUF962 domain-containing protein [Pseudomonadati]|uniref:Mpo1 family 2-hydroxy fatty acid dioxygenase n=1 Tax=unclassified Halobacteriovorax TaxID=2639665 RepID=UPI000CD2503D|nr:Mpo1-like protein [Halobacteriovorax sp. DA5]POB15116.1 hypothetical protein C0Z22_01680 [Halobacteriovorax sp. DA5]
MRSLETWLEMYGESHQNKTNQRIHEVCVPLITWSLLGMLWAIPKPALFGYFNWAWAFVILASLFYLSLKNLKAITVALSLVIPFMLLTQFFLVNFLAEYFFITWIVVFVVAWVGQFIGHKIEGKKPSFFEDLQFLLIGPIWIFLGKKS